MPVGARYNVPQLPADEVHELVLMHRQKRMRLAFSVGMDGQAVLQGDPVPQNLVSALLVLAAIGAEAVAAVETSETPGQLIQRALHNLSEATR